MASKLPETRRERTQADFSLATVNIVLLLVFFFLITGTLVETDEQSVDLAETTDLPIERLPRPLLLMRPGGAWSLDGEPVSPATLALAVDETFARLQVPARVLHLLPDRNVPASEMIALLQRQDLADTQIKLVTLRLRAAQP